MGAHIFKRCCMLRPGCFRQVLSFGLHFAYNLLSGLCGNSLFQKDGVRDWITKYNKPSLVESMQATKPYIEKTREFFGLLIIAGALLINYLVL
jgi:hypothetical protein